MQNSVFPPVISRWPSSRSIGIKKSPGTHFSGTRPSKSNSERVFPEILKSKSESVILESQKDNFAVRKSDSFEYPNGRLYVEGLRATLFEPPSRTKSKFPDPLIRNVRSRTLSLEKLPDVFEQPASIKVDQRSEVISLKEAVFELMDYESKFVEIGTKIKALGLKVMIVEDQLSISRTLQRVLSKAFGLDTNNFHLCKSAECVGRAMATTSFERQVAFIILDNNILDKVSQEVSPELKHSESFFVGASFGAMRASVLQTHFNCPIFGNSADYEGLPRVRAYSEGDVFNERTPENGYWSGVNDRVSKKGQLMELFQDPNSTSLNDIWDHLLRIEASR